MHLPCEPMTSASRPTPVADCGVDPKSCGCIDMEGIARISLVSNGDALMTALNRALAPCPLEVRLLRSCQEACVELGSSTTAEVIFTDVQLPDGDWRQLLSLARERATRVEVIVVSRFVDIDLYLDTLEAGAFDFVVPPFRTEELGYVVVNAMYECYRQRTRRISGNSPDPMAA